MDYLDREALHGAWNSYPQRPSVGGSAEQRRALDDGHVKLVAIHKTLTPAQQMAWETLWPHDKYDLAELPADERSARLDELAKALDFGEPLDAGYGISDVEPEAA